MQDFRFCDLPGIAPGAQYNNLFARICNATFFNVISNRTNKVSVILVISPCLNVTLRVYRVKTVYVPSRNCVCECAHESFSKGLVFAKPCGTIFRYQQISPCPKTRSTVVTIIVLHRSESTNSTAVAMHLCSSVHTPCNTYRIYVSGGLFDLQR
jgi:hypothetical protein